jgi:DNA-3-methyladenine glycosylase II
VNFSPAPKLSFTINYDSPSESKNFRYTLARHACTYPRNAISWINWLRNEQQYPHQPRQLYRYSHRLAAPTFNSRLDINRHSIVSTVHRVRLVDRLFTTLHYRSVQLRMASRRSSRLTAQAELKNVESDPTKVAPPVSAQPKGRKRGAAAAENGPTTPKKRKRNAADLTPVTPKAKAGTVNLNAEPVNGAARPVKNAAVTRLADPRATNAPLLSPETSHIIASKPVATVSPSKLSGVKTTTANILEEACQHLIKVDPRMKPLIEKHTCRIFTPEGLAEKIDPFETLISGIISQQVSGAAAKSIKAKFIALFEDKTGRGFPVPSQVAACSIEKLRTAGLSQRKAEYVQGLAEKFANGKLSTQMLVDAPYEELLEKLIEVRGLGRWSVEMFACFGLKRMDVFSLGDLGVQRGMAAFVGRDIAKLKAKGGKWKYMSEKEMQEISDRFAPFRSLFMWYMWRVEETDVSTLE